LFGLIYHLQGKDYHQYNIEETGRNLGVRVKEHTSRKGSNSAMKEHLSMGIILLYP
jgi:hypothetical protein